MWWCAPHYQKGMPNSVARGRSQSNFLHHQRPPLHYTSSSILRFFFHKCKSTGYTPQLSFIMVQGWRDSTLVGKFLTSLMERWDVIAHHRESRKTYIFGWPSFLGSTKKPKSPNLWTLCLQWNNDRKVKQNGLNWTHRGPAEDLDMQHGPLIISKYCQKHKWPKALSTLTHSTT